MKSLMGRFIITISLLFVVFSIRLGMIIARQGGAGAVSTLDHGQCHNCQYLRAPVDSGLQKGGTFMFLGT